MSICKTVFSSLKQVHTFIDIYNYTQKVLTTKRLVAFFFKFKFFFYCMGKNICLFYTLQCYEWMSEKFLSFSIWSDYFVTNLVKHQWSFMIFGYHCFCNEMKIMNEWITTFILSSTIIYMHKCTSLPFKYILVG